MDSKAYKEAADAIRAVGRAITPGDVMPGSDAYGGNISCLTESMMGISRGLQDIAEALREVASSIEHHK